MDCNQGLIKLRFLSPIRNKISHFGDLLPSQSFTYYWKKLNQMATKANMHPKQNILQHLIILVPGKPVPERWNQSGFYWSKRQWVAVASAGPYASLHLAPDRYHASTPPISFLQAGCPSCRPTNSVKALKAHLSGTRCRFFLHISWCHWIPKRHHLLPHLNPDWSYLSGTGLPRLSWKRGR